MPVKPTNEAEDSVELILEEASPSSSEIEQIEKIVPKQLTILGVVQRPLFPGLPVPMSFSGPNIVKIIQEVQSQEGGYIGVVFSKNNDSFSLEDGDGDLYKVGTLFKILKIIQSDEQTVQMIGQGLNRFRKTKTLSIHPSIKWEVEHHFDSKLKPKNDLKAYMMAISSDLKALLRLNPVFQEQVNMVVNQLNGETPGNTIDIISNLIGSDGETLQGLLETFDVYERAKLLLTILKNELELTQLQVKINKEIEATVNQQQKEFFLREQLKAIKKELGLEKEEGASDIEKIENRLKGKNLSEDAQKAVSQELDKLRTLNAQSPEFNVTRSYLELISELPWGTVTEDNLDIKKARKILDEEHYGLEDVKDVILEFLSAVIKSKRISGSIICLVGPPGVGKTSIGKSVADALGRKFFRFSVGGMRDEAEIKGHRRTYIGALPGKLLMALKRVGADNPVVMLDEIDKIGKSFQGDPASALLEVLDPEQNATFLDHYLDIPYDLSNILFLTTANQLDTIPGPLRDRMEVIRLSGYILEDKIEIAKRYLIPPQLKEIGYNKSDIKFTDKGLAFLIDNYAREAGVRNLEKLIRRLIRKVNVIFAESDRKSFTINEKEIENLIGQPYFNTEKLYPKPIVGVVLGLAYTAFGGATLYIEAAGIPSKGPSLKQTGQLGNVMRESSEIAHSFIRSLLGRKYGVENYLEQHHVHLHVPAGATPKDGPSAGITMALALYSLAENKTIIAGLGMTGELTLTGKVLPIGGVKEKTIAARRVGLQTLIFPKDNKKDFENLPDYIKAGIQVHFVDYFEDVLKVAFAK